MITQWYDHTFISIVGRISVICFIFGKYTPWEKVQKRTIDNVGGFCQTKILFNSARHHSYFWHKQKKHIHQNKELSFSRAQPPVALSKGVSQSNPLISFLANYILVLRWDQIFKASMWPRRCSWRRPQLMFWWVWNNSTCYNILLGIKRREPRVSHADNN